MTTGSNDPGAANSSPEAGPASAQPSPPPTDHHGHGLPFKLPFVEKLKQRHIGRIAILYVVSCSVALELLSLFIHVLDLPAWIGRTVLVLMVLGLPLVLIFTWALEDTHDGVKSATDGDSRQAIRKLTGRRLDLAIIAALSVALAYFVADKFWLSKHFTEAERPSTPSAEAVPPVRSAQSTIPDKSIAVLPFVDMSEKKDQEYFGDGMAEEILNLLVRIPELKVIGRTSSFQFKGKTNDVREIGAALGVAYFVEGSVRRSGDHVRVTAQLIGTRDGTHRWSETYDRNAGDVLKVQGEIATNVVRALQLEVATSSHWSTQAPLHNNESYDLYLRGLHAFSRYDQSGFEEAIADFRRALDLDPTFVPAAAALARCLGSMVEWTFVPTQSGWEKARAAAEAALKLDANSALAHAVLGSVHFEYDWDWPAAERELNAAMALAPSNSSVLQFAAIEQMAVGRYREAVHLQEAAVASDPLDAEFIHVIGWSYMRLNRLADAERTFRRALDISPTYTWGYYFLGVALLLEGRAEDALAVMQKETFEEAKVSGLAVVYQALHRTKEADAALARLETEFAESEALEVAEAYAFRRQKDQAFKWLDRAYAQKDNSLYYVKGDPLLKNLEGDPRYKAFLRKMNLPE